MLVYDRCRLAAAASSRSLQRVETRKLTGTISRLSREGSQVSRHRITVVPLYRTPRYMNLMFLKGGHYQPLRSAEAIQ